MPTILLFKGFRFFFYSNENSEPIHIHVKKGDAEGKVWLEPTIEIAYLHSFTNTETKEIIEIADLYKNEFKKKWNEYFNK